MMRARDRALEERLGREESEAHQAMQVLQEFKDPRGWMAYRAHPESQETRLKQGPRGPRGPVGRRGVEGPRGDEGPKGNDGKPGAPGFPGPPGLAGMAWSIENQTEIYKKFHRGFRTSVQARQTRTAGTAGTAGTRRECGVRSFGLRGDKGERGVPGQNGSPGRMGDVGQSGLSGKSLCQVSSNAGQNLCCGESDDFELDGESIYVNIDTSKCSFATQPIYFTSLYGTTSNALVYSEDNIIETEHHRVDKKHLKVYLRSRDPLELDDIRSHGWSLKWCGMGISFAARPQKLSMCCGSADSSQWKYGASGLSKRIDTSGCDLSNVGDSSQDTPYYFASLSDSSCGSDLRSSEHCTAKVYGFNGIHAPTNDGFTVDIRPVAGEQSLSASSAKHDGWKLNWCAVKELPHSYSRQEGFPCDVSQVLQYPLTLSLAGTNPRILVGNGKQQILSNYGQICCGQSR
eukprot:64852-Hanusia_phi.AAC.8